MARVRKAVFPVDTHIYRIAIRLGVMDASVPFARSHEGRSRAVIRIAPEPRCGSASRSPTSKARR